MLFAPWVLFRARSSHSDPGQQTEDWFSCVKVLVCISLQHKILESGSLLPSWKMGRKQKRKRSWGFYVHSFFSRVFLTTRQMQYEHLWSECCHRMHRAFTGEPDNQAHGKGWPHLDQSTDIYIYIYKIYTYKFFVSFFKILCKSQFEQQEQKLQKTSRLSGMETIRVVLDCDVWSSLECTACQLRGHDSGRIAAPDLILHIHHSENVNLSWR